jgi:1-acyl-sn-glycerol-3-phosphate acyltransferase
MFPEGTRSSGTDVGRFRPGFLAILRRTDQPVYPVGIAGTDACLPRGAWFLRPGRVQLVYGKPLSAEELQKLHDTSTGDAELCELTRLKVVECVNEAARMLERRI